MKKRQIIKRINNVFGTYWIVRNKKKELLGTFSYQQDWKEMSWSQAKGIRMGKGCLRELADAMERREKRRLSMNKEVCKNESKTS